MNYTQFDRDIQLVCNIRKNYKHKWKYVQPATPIELITEITNQLNIQKSDSVLVLFTIEWALYLRREGFENVTVAAYSDAVESFCRKFGFKFVNLTENNNMKFDAVVGNPPYQQGKNNNFYQDFVNIAMQYSTGIVAMVTPSNWTSFADKDSKFLTTLKENGLCYYKFLGADAFKDVQLLTVYFICSKDNTSNSVTIETTSSTDVVLLKDLCYFPTENSSLFKVISKINSANLPGLVAVKGRIDRNKIIQDQTGHRCILSVGKKGGDFDLKYVSNSHITNNDVIGFGYHKVVISRITSIGKLGEAKYAGPEYSCAQGCYAIYVNSEDEAIELIDYLNSPVVKGIVKEIKGAVCSNSQNIFNFIPNVQSIPELNRLLTDNDIALIESTVK